MKLKSSNIGKAKLRREQFNRSQNKVNFKSKSLSSRIIEKRVKSITANNIDVECERLACLTKVDELLATIMYHIKFARDARPYTFDDDVIIGVLDRIKDLQIKFAEGIISAKQHVECLEEIDAQIMKQINNWEQCK